MTICNVGQSLQKLLACAQIMSELSMARSSKVCNANFFVSRSADLHRVISASAERKRQLLSQNSGCMQKHIKSVYEHNNVINAIHMVLYNKCSRKYYYTAVCSNIMF